MEALIIYSLLTTALFYLGSRATITRRLWMTYPPALARFADCPACIGTWHGFGLAIGVGRPFEIDVFMFKSDSFVTPFVVAFFTMVLTPMVAGLMQHALNVVGTAVDLDEHDVDVRKFDNHDE